MSKRVAWMNDKSVYPTMSFVPPISLDNTIAWFKKNQNSAQRIDVALEENGEVVAFGGLTNIDYRLRKAEFYVFVGPEHQRKGYGTRSTYLVCKYAFDILQLHKVYLLTNNTNEGAKRTYEKVGFKLEGIHREEKVVKDGFEDRLYYGLLSSEFDYQREPLNMDFVQTENVRLAVVRDDIFPAIGGVIRQENP